MSLGALRLPDALGDLLGAYKGAQWWYFVGHLAAKEDPAQLYSVELQILRVRDFDGFPPVTFSLVGVGDARPTPELYHSFLGAGDAALVAPTWDRFSISSFADVDAAAPDAPPCINYTFVGGDGVGLEGGAYSLSARATATTKPGAATKTEVAIELSLVDERGAMFEGASGSLLNTYEFSQPRLNVTGGSLRIGDEAIPIGSGNLWNDMQTIFTAFNGSLSDAVPPPRRGLGGDLPPTYQWLSLVFDNDACVEMSSIWHVKPHQWLTGAALGHPARTGYGVFYRPRKTHYEYAYATGGYPLVPLHDCVFDGRRGANDNSPTDCPYPDGVPWDFSVDVLDPADPEASPHWTSPDTNRTYATALAVSFGGRLVADLGYARVYLYAIVDNAEAVLSTSTENVAAARIYDRPITEAGASQIGAAVIEQYGYNN